MKPFLVFLCLVGAAFYLLTPPPAPRERAAEARTADQTGDNREAGQRPIASWGSSLHSLRNETELGNETELARADASPAAPSEAPRAIPEQDRDKQEAQPAHGAKPSRSMEQAPAPPIADAERETVEWVRLTAAVRARSAASASSPGLWSYPAGSKAQVVGRADGWVQLLDPKTEERGWVYHAYLAPIDAAQTETASAPPPVEAASPTSPTPVRTANPAARTSDAVKVRKAQRPRRGLFKRRRARKAWSLGPAR